MQQRFHLCGPHWKRCVEQYGPKVKLWPKWLQFLLNEHKNDWYYLVHKAPRYTSLDEAIEKGHVALEGAAPITSIHYRQRTKNVPKQEAKLLTR